MKSLMSYIILSLLGFTILLVADLLSGIRLSQALTLLKHSFALKTPIESLLIPAAICIPLVPPLRAYLKRKSNTKSNSND